MQPVVDAHARSVAMLAAAVSVAPGFERVVVHGAVPPQLRCAVLQACPGAVVVVCDAGGPAAGVDVGLVVTCGEVDARKVREGGVVVVWSGGGGPPLDVQVVVGEVPWGGALLAVGMAAPTVTAMRAVVEAEAPLFGGVGFLADALFGDSMTLQHMLLWWRLSGRCTMPDALRLRLVRRLGLALPHSDPSQAVGLATELSAAHAGAAHELPCPACVAAPRLRPPLPPGAVVAAMPRFAGLEVPRATVPEPAPVPPVTPPGAVDACVPLSSSALFKSSAEFYKAQGVGAWADGTVPHEITSSRHLAHACAVRVFRAAVRVAAAVSTPKPHTWHVCDVGAGTGEFSHGLAVELASMAASYNAAVHTGSALRFVTVVCDLSEEALRTAAARPCFRALAVAGEVEFAVVDAGWFLGAAGAGDDRPIACLSGKLLTGLGPLVVVGNYLFDSLPPELLRVTGDGVFTGRVTTLGHRGRRDARAASFPNPKTASFSFVRRARGMECAAAGDCPGCDAVDSVVTWCAAHVRCGHALLPTHTIHLLAGLRAAQASPDAPFVVACNDKCHAPCDTALFGEPEAPVLPCLDRHGSWEAGAFSTSVDVGLLEVALSHPFFAPDGGAVRHGVHRSDNLQSSWFYSSVALVGVGAPAALGAEDWELFVAYLRDEAAFRERLSPAAWCEALSLGRTPWVLFQDMAWSIARSMRRNADHNATLVGLAIQCFTSRFQDTPVYDARRLRRRPSAALLMARWLHVVGAALDCVAIGRPAARAAPRHEAGAWARLLSKYD